MASSKSKFPVFVIHIFFLDFIFQVLALASGPELGQLARSLGLVESLILLELVWKKLLQHSLPRECR